MVRQASHTKPFVSIHARTWRATLFSRNEKPAHEVSIHARTWRATCRLAWQAEHRTFQSTPARGGRPGTLTTNSAGKVFQSTPARGGRQGADTAADALRYVSIHARTWRATQRLTTTKENANVSIHARTWRATRNTAENPPKIPCFNPRPHVAGDLKFPAISASTLVSIHARTWRATRHRNPGGTRRPVSIHARTWRAT